MVKLIAAFCAFLLAVALAAPVAEDTNPLPDAKDLIEKADPVENDISAPRTDLPPQEETPVKEQTENSKTIFINDDKVEESQKQEETPIETEPTGKTAEETPEEATPSEDTTPDDVVTNIENETAEGSPYEGLVPVDEVIPPPEVAFVLGEYAGAPNHPDKTKYQVVQGETEEGMPVLSEYAPDGANDDIETFDYTVFPIAEATVHDYPPAEIIPEAEFNQEGDSGMAEISSLNPEAAMDYDAPLEDSLPVHEISPDEAVDGFNPDYDYPVDSTFVGPLEYPTDYPPGFFDDSSHYDTPVDGFMAGPVMNVDLPPVDYPDMPNMEDAFHHSDMSDMSPNFDNIVAGLEARYHPGPIPGFGPHPDERHLDGPEANYPVYKDQPIIPGAMLGSNPPVAEAIHKVDTPVPERVSMDDVSESNAIMAIDDSPVDEFIDTNSIVSVPDDFDIDILPHDDQGLKLDHSMANSNFYDKPDIVIQLSLNNQEASVNGRPFEMSQATNMLTFIGELIAKATFSPIPMMEETNDRFNPNPEHPARDMPMNDFLNRNMGPPFSHPYPLYGDMNNYDNSYYPDNNEFDYNPYHPFFNPTFNRGMNPTFDNMASNIYHNRFGFEFPSRDRRFAYNPTWY